MGWFWKHPRPAPRCRARATWRRCSPSTSSRKRSRTTATCASWRRTSTTGATSSASSRTCWRPGARPSPIACRWCASASSRSTSRRCVKRREAIAAEVAAGEAAGDGVAFADAKQLDLLGAHEGRARASSTRPTPTRKRSSSATGSASSPGVLAWQLVAGLGRPPLGRQERARAHRGPARRSQAPRRRARRGAARGAGCASTASRSRIAAINPLLQVMIPRVAGLSREQRTRGAGHRRRRADRPAAAHRRLHDAGALRARPALRPRLWQTGCRPGCLGQALSRLALRPAALAVAAACALVGVRRCSGGGGTPDNEPTLKTLAGRKVDGRQGRRRRRQRGARRSRPIASSSTSRRRRRSARKRCAASATSRWTAPTPERQRRGFARRHAGRRAAPDYKAAIARYQDYLKTYPADPGQRPRPLPAGARLRAGRRPRVGAEDARPPGQGLPGDALPQRGAVPARRAAVHDARTTPAPRRRSRPCSPRPTRNPYHDRSLYMHGWSQYKQGRLEDGLQSFFGVLDLKVAGTRRRGRPRRARRPDAAPTASWSRTPSASPASASPTCRAPSRSPPFIDDAGAQELRVPRLRAARRALHQAGADQGRGRHLRRLRAHATRCTRRRRCCRRA